MDLWKGLGAKDGYDYRADSPGLRSLVLKFISFP